MRYRWIPGNTDVLVGPVVMQHPASCWRSHARPSAVEEAFHRLGTERWLLRRSRTALQTPLSHQYRDSHQGSNPVRSLRNTDLHQTIRRFWHIGHCLSISGLLDRTAHGANLVILSAEFHNYGDVTYR